MTRMLTLGIALLGAALPAFGQVAPERVALTGVRILPVSGPEIGKGTIVIERGKIAAVGKTGDVEVPFDARVFELDDHVVMPGLIDVHTWRGMDQPNESRPVTPQLDAYDAIDPSQLFFEDSLRLGVTAVHVMPGDNTVIGGLGRVVHPIGLTLSEMTIAPGSFLKISVAPRRGSERMTQMASIREAFAELDDQLAKLAESRYEEDRKEKEEPVDVMPVEARKRGVKLIRVEDLTDQTRNLVRLTGGTVEVEEETTDPLLDPLGAFVYCEKAMDVPAAIEIAREYGFFDRLVLVLDAECHKAIPAMKKAARPVVLTGDLLHRETDPLTGKVRETFVPKLYADAGLEFSLLPGPSSSLPERMLTYQAARCVRGGVPRSVALRAITLNPAKALGLEDSLGTIEPGRIANLAVFTGDPLDFNSVVQRVFINGIPAYDRQRDVRLQRLLSLQQQDSDGKAE